MPKILISNYKFTPGNANLGKIQLHGNVAPEELLIVNNATSNELIYNFADTAIGHVSGTYVYDSTDSTTFGDDANGVTTFFLKKDTSSMNSADSL